MLVCLLLGILNGFDVNILGWDVKGDGKSGVKYSTLMEKTLLRVSFEDVSIYASERGLGSGREREG